MAGEDWTDAENDLIVADHFSMLALDIVGKRFNKAERYRNLQQLLPSRSIKSIEWKHRNISAIVENMAIPTIKGLLPAPAYQQSLIEAVFRWNGSNGDLFYQSHLQGNPQRLSDNVQPLFISEAPDFRVKETKNAKKVASAVRKKYDAGKQDAQNHALGLSGEQLVLEYEIANLRAASREDLAEKVSWTSQVEGDGAGYDIASFESDGTKRLLEVKTTNGWERTPFYISRNEVAVAQDNSSTWHLVRLWDFARSPRAFSIRPPLEEHVTLAPVSFLASFQG